MNKIKNSAGYERPEATFIMLDIETPILSASTQLGNNESFGEGEEQGWD